MVSSDLDPAQDQCSVRPDLGPSYQTTKVVTSNHFHLLHFFTNSFMK